MFTYVVMNAQQYHTMKKTKKEINNARKTPCTGRCRMKLFAHTSDKSEQVQLAHARGGEFCTAAPQIYAGNL